MPPILCHVPHSLEDTHQAIWSGIINRLRLLMNDVHGSVRSLITNVNTSSIKTETETQTQTRRLTQIFFLHQIVSLRLSSSLVVSEELRVYRAQQKEAEVVRLKEAMQGGRVRMMTSSIHDSFRFVMYFFYQFFFFFLPKGCCVNSVC